MDIGAKKKIHEARRGLSYGTGVQIGNGKDEDGGFLPRNYDKKNRNAAAVVFRLSIFILFVGLLFTSYYFYDKYREASDSNRENAELIGKISEMIYLPDGEDPSIATVIDSAKINQQQFFSRAENGDKLLVYQKARFIILYRPTEDKIVSASFLSAPEGVSIQEPLEGGDGGGNFTVEAEAEN